MIEFAQMRKDARLTFRVRSDLKKTLETRGIVIRAASMEVVAEEAPDAYKDVDRVAEVSHQLGIGTKVVRMTPIGVAKG